MKAGNGMLDQAILEDAMRRTFALARRGPADDQNPQVGCVLLDSAGRIVAEGWHRGAGTPHAETAALAELSSEWRGRIRELTAVVTLEPCNHTGRTGPCALALCEAGIGAVAYALDDPGAESSGGADRLRSADLEVRGGVLADEARELLDPWLARQSSFATERRRNREEGAVLPASFDSLRRLKESEHADSHSLRPHVTVKWAQTLDGRAAAADGSSRWITGPEARRDVHRRRAEADAILVGTGTLHADDPALTARAAERSGRATTDGAPVIPDLLLVPAARQPVPVVLGHRPIPAGARVLQHPALAANRLAEPLRLTGDDLPADLAVLHGRGIRRLFIEGGPTVASAFIAAGLVDEALVYIAPALLGGPRLAIGDLGIVDMTGIERLNISHTERLGDDLLIRAAFTQEAH